MEDLQSLDSAGKARGSGLRRSPGYKRSYLIRGVRGRRGKRRRGQRKKEREGKRMDNGVGGLTV